MINAYRERGVGMSVAELLEGYRKGPEQLEAAVAGFSREQFLARPIADKWTTLEVLCHVADCEQFIAERIKRILSFTRPLLLGVDENAYAAALRYDRRDAAEELALVWVTRSQILRILQDQPAEAWERFGIHTESGQMPLKLAVFHAHFHLHHHLKFVLEKRSALGL